MHIPDGFINGGTSAAAGVVAAAGLGTCLVKTAKTMDEKQVPLAGLAAAFIFAVQMLNFPVANGTSGHLLGGVLAAVLVGPWAGALCVSVVLVVQALLFADGGLSALGLNVINMALVGAWGGYLVFLALRKLGPRTKGAVVACSGIAAALAPVLASLVFTFEYAIGGNGAASVATVAAAMVGTHVLIGIGEGIITALAIGAVMAVRPDIVYGARDLAASAAPPPAPVLVEPALGV
jgi:cobalt/nickel transport system permease protein